MYSLDERSLKQTFSNLPPLDILPEQDLLDILRQFEELKIELKIVTEKMLEILGLPCRINNNRLNGQFSGNPKIDYALYMCKEYYHPEEWVGTFQKIMDKINLVEEKIKKHKGGIMLVDLTSQKSDPPCIKFAIIEVPENSSLQILTKPGYFRGIPISIHIPTTSIYYIEPEHYLDNSIKPEDQNSLDITSLFHINWGTWRVPFAGVVEKNQIQEHIKNWRVFLNERLHRDGCRNFYFDFLDYIASKVESLSKE